MGRGEVVHGGNAHELGELVAGPRGVQALEGGEDRGDVERATRGHGAERLDAGDLVTLGIVAGRDGKRLPKGVLERARHGLIKRLVAGVLPRAGGLDREVFARLVDQTVGHGQVHEALRAATLGLGLALADDRPVHEDEGQAVRGHGGLQGPQEIRVAGVLVPMKTVHARLLDASVAAHDGGHRGGELAELA